MGRLGGRRQPGERRQPVVRNPGWGDGSHGLGSTTKCGCSETTNSMNYSSVVVQEYMARNAWNEESAKFAQGDIKAGENKQIQQTHELTLADRKCSTFAEDEPGEQQCQCMGWGSCERCGRRRRSCGKFCPFLTAGF